LDGFVNRQDTFPLWEGLAREGDRTLTERFLDACAVALAEWERMPRVSDGAIDKNLSRLAAQALKLADELAVHAAEISFSGIPVTVLACPSTDAPHAEQETRSTDTSKVAASEGQPSFLHPRYLGLLSNKREVKQVPVHTLLRELAQRFTAIDRYVRNPLRPTKRNWRTAERTFLAKTLYRFFLENGGQPHWQWIALSIAAMTNSVTLDVQHVERLVPDLSPPWSSEGEMFAWYSKHVWGEPPDLDQE
jgi:hypothetical protein